MVERVFVVVEGEDKGCGRIEAQASATPRFSKLVVVAGVPARLGRWTGQHYFRREPAVACTTALCSYTLFLHDTNTTAGNPIAEHNDDDYDFKILNMVFLVSSRLFLWALSRPLYLKHVPRRPVMVPGRLDVTQSAMASPVGFFRVCSVRSADMNMVDLGYRAWPPEAC
ncbi:uncharacterized protein BKA78DRAFT_348761 [Phyllosticta capitalensis]|uniref:uncharacterized protein n=1 Tax=Phyllosticta capitalensis TaxID=121624 RepID=UPI00312D441C